MGKQSPSSKKKKKLAKMAKKEEEYATSYEWIYCFYIVLIVLSTAALGVFWLLTRG